MRLLPEPVAELAVGEVYTDLDFPPSVEAGNGRRPYTVINAVGTLDGRGAMGGKSTPLGSEVDHRLMRNIRSCVDAVLVGAGTLRSENLTLTVENETLLRRRRARGLREQPLSIILGGNREIPAERRIFRAGRANVLVFVKAGSSPANTSKLETWATVRKLDKGPGMVDPEQVLETLATEFDVRHLLIEGGPRVNRSFIEGRMVDEIFLTLVPKVVGGEPRSLIDDASLLCDLPAARLVSVYRSGSELYLRYRLDNSL